MDLQQSISGENNIGQNLNEQGNIENLNLIESKLNIDGKANNSSLDMSYETAATLNSKFIDQNNSSELSINKGDSSMQKNEEEEEDKIAQQFRRLSSPLIKTVMAETRCNKDPTKFSMHHWAEFQEILKSNFFVIKNETRTKEKIVEEVDKLIKDYNNIHLNIRENNEKIRRKLNREPGLPNEDEIVRVILDDKNCGFSDANIFVKKLLYAIFEKPKIIAVLVKSQQDLSSLKALEETLCTTFYEDIIADEIYDYDLIRLLAELLEVEFEKAQKYGDLFHNEHFTNKMLTSYLRRHECKRYVKSILKNPLLACIREPGKIRLDPIDIQRLLDKRKDKLTRKGSSIEVSSSAEKDPKNRKSGESLKELIFGKKSHSAAPVEKPVRKEEPEEIPIPRFKSKKNVKPKESKDKIPFDSQETRLSKIESKEVLYVLDRSMRLLKKSVSYLVQSIFDNLHSMPTGLRILCKIIHSFAKQKFPNLREKEYNEILGNYLIRKWISPNFIFPEHNEILNDFTANNDMSDNFMQVAKVLQNIFNQQFFSPDDVRYALNDYIAEIIPSVAEFYKELISVNEDLVEQIRLGKAKTTKKIRSRSICISVHEIQMLCDGILKMKTEMQQLSPEVVQLAERIMYYEKNEKIFGDKTNPQTKKPLKTHQAHMLISEIFFPDDIVAQYLEEFNKMQGFDKTLPEDGKLLCRAKHLLKNVLLNIEDVKNMMRLSADGNVTLNDVLEKYQEKIYSYESKHANSKEKTPVYITARFLLSVLGRLDKSYTENNYQKLYYEMFTDFNKLAIKLDYSISTTKLQLLKALDTLKRNIEAMKEINDKKKKAIKKTYIREFITIVKISLCVTSPSTMKHLGISQKGDKKKAPQLPDKIEITARDEKGCIHERFAIIRELAANGGVMGGTAPSREGGGDIFNENNYHCDTIPDFINIFGSFSEVKEAIISGKDEFGCYAAMNCYYEKLNTQVKMSFSKVTEEEQLMIMDEIENYICKRLYPKVFPTVESPDDAQFWKRCKVLDWVTYEHLEIIPRNRCEEMWEYAANVLNQIDNRLTPIDKLECIVECFKIITQVIELAASKEGGGGADDTLPIVIYVLLKACPKRLPSNLNYITLLRDNEKMLAGEGYCFTQVKSAMMTIEAMKHHFLRLSEEEFNELIHEKEKEYQISLKKTVSE